jgi:hypothetical protein
MNLLRVVALFVQTNWSGTIFYIRLAMEGLSSHNASSPLSYCAAGT